MMTPSRHATKPCETDDAKLDLQFAAYTLKKFRW